MVKKYPKILPSLQELEQVRGKIKSIPNKQGEFKRKIHYGCFLLCSESGLRISEAVKFDLSLKKKSNLYLIQGKKHRKRFVFIDPQVIETLKQNH